MCKCYKKNPNSSLSTLISLSMKQEVDLNMRINWQKVVNFNSKKVMIRDWKNDTRRDYNNIPRCFGNGGHGH